MHIFKTIAAHTSRNVDHGIAFVTDRDSVSGLTEDMLTWKPCVERRGSATFSATSDLASHAIARPTISMKRFHSYAIAFPCIYKDLNMQQHAAMGFACATNLSSTSYMYSTKGISICHFQIALSVMPSILGALKQATPFVHAESPLSEPPGPPRLYRDELEAKDEDIFPLLR